VRGTGTAVLGQGLGRPTTSDLPEQGSAIAAKMIRVAEPVHHVRPAPPPPQRRVHKLIVWEGTVTERMEASFLCRLTDPAGKEREQVAEVPFAEVGVGDVDLVEPGGIFYWTIAHVDERSGTRSRLSQIQFRRLPRYSQSDLDSGSATADAIRDRFGW
jgi:hypothetical protein